MKIVDRRGHEDEGRGDSIEEEVYWRRQENKKLKDFFERGPTSFSNNSFIYFLKS